MADVPDKLFTHLSISRMRLNQIFRLVTKCRETMLTCGSAETYFSEGLGLVLSFLLLERINQQWETLNANHACQILQNIYISSSLCKSAAERPPPE